MSIPTPPSSHPLAKMMTAQICGNTATGYNCAWIERAEQIERYTGETAPPEPVTHLSGAPECEYAHPFNPAIAECHCGPGNLYLHIELAEEFCTEWLECMLHRALSEVFDREAIAG